MKNAILHVARLSFQDNTVRDVLGSVGSVVISLGDHRLGQIGLSNDGTTNSANLADEGLRAVVDKNRGNVVLATVRSETVSLIARRALAGVVTLSRKMNATSKFVTVVTERMAVGKSTTVDLKNIDETSAARCFLGLQIAGNIGNLKLATLASNTVELRRSTNNQ